MKIEIKSKGRKNMNKFHRYHVIPKSIWPISVALFVLCVIVGFMDWVKLQHGVRVITHYYDVDGYYLYSLGGIGDVFILTATEGIFLLIFISALWFRDILKESREHTPEVRRGIKLGMKLFIASEIMFFFAFFWSDFYISFMPSVHVGGVWPSMLAIKPYLPYQFSLPALNTGLLIASGFWVTCSHHGFRATVKLTVKFLFAKAKVKQGIKPMVLKLFHIVQCRTLAENRAIFCLAITVLLAFIFLCIQGYEYMVLPLDISDGSYGSLFYLLTGFHGLHVLIGTLFLVTVLAKMYASRQLRHSIGLVCAIWYWHFVDAVWIALFFVIYWWNNRKIDLEQVKEGYGISDALLELGFTDVPKFEQLFFQDPATATMSQIIDLHNTIFYYLIIVFCQVISFLAYVLKNGKGVNF